MPVKLIASDLDGTIIDKNNNISDKNFDAIKKIHQKHIPFAVCTGKSYAVSKNLCSKFNANYGIFGNGTQIIDFSNGKEIFKKTLSKEDLLFIVTFAKRYNYHIHLYTSNTLIAEKLDYMALRNYKLKQNEKNSTLSFKIVSNIKKYIETNDNLNVYSCIVSTNNMSLNSFKLYLNTNSNISSIYINKRGQYKDNVIHKDYEYLSISPNNINKDIAVTYLANYLKINKKDVMTLGDNMNDFEMIQNAGYGIAVNDAYDEIKQIAKYVTESNVSNGAFAEAIYKFI